MLYAYGLLSPWYMFFVAGELVANGFFFDGGVDVEGSLPVWSIGTMGERSGVASGGCELERAESNT